MDAADKAHLEAELAQLRQGLAGRSSTICRRRPAQERRARQGPQPDRGRSRLADAAVDAAGEEEWFAGLAPLCVILHISSQLYLRDQPMQPSNLLNGKWTKSKLPERLPSLAAGCAAEGELAAGGCKSRAQRAGRARQCTACRGAGQVGGAREGAPGELSSPKVCWPLIVSTACLLWRCNAECSNHECWAYA